MKKAEKHKDRVIDWEPFFPESDHEVISQISYPVARNLTADHEFSDELLDSVIYEPSECDPKFDNFVSKYLPFIFSFGAIIPLMFIAAIVIGSIFC